MKLCDRGCIPCCDFCIHAEHETMIHFGRTVKLGPCGCMLHPDDEHQKIAKDYGSCNDYHCFRYKEAIVINE